jgi:hypothetical protein
MRDWIGKLRKIRPVRPAAPDRGTTTAEYAIVTMAAVAFATVLLHVLSGGAVSKILTDLVKRALTV